MRCPFCRSLDNHVVDSRATEDGGAIRRRRECEGCRKRFTSYERVEEALPMVVKKDGRREAFDRRKLVAGIMVACQKRPVAQEAIDQVVNGLERRMVEEGEREIPTTYVGALVMDGLRTLDEVAYVRFASVYRSFADITEFTAEVERLRQKAGERSTPAGAEALPRLPRRADA